jgi:hypothetical protein
VTEWNATVNGNCLSSTLANDDPTSVGWLGANLVAAIATGQNSAYFTGNSTPSGGGCAWIDTSGNLLPKDYAYLVLKQLGLNVGTGAVKATTVNGLSEAAGAVNSAGQPVVVLANWFSAQNVTVTMNNLVNGTYNLKTYLADYGINIGSNLIENTSVNVSGGSTSHTITMTPYSVAGIILNSAPPMP